MSTEQNDKWLDELISQSIDTTKPQFDAEQWKAKHPHAIRSILSRRTKRAAPVHPVFLGTIFAHPFAGLAAAAAVIVVVSGLWIARDEPITNGLKPEPPQIAKSPAEIVSMMSLRTAYRTGGWDALDQQLQKTLETFRPGPSSVSMQQLLDGFNGS